MGSLSRAFKMRKQHSHQNASSFQWCLACLNVSTPKPPANWTWKQKSRVSESTGPFSTECKSTSAHRAGAASAHLAKKRLHNMPQLDDVQSFSETPSFCMEQKMLRCRVWWLMWLLDSLDWGNQWWMSAARCLIQGTRKRLAEVLCKPNK